MADRAEGNVALTQVDVREDLNKCSDAVYEEYKSNSLDGRSWTWSEGWREGWESGVPTSVRQHVLFSSFTPTQSHSLSGELRTRHHG